MHSHHKEHERTFHALVKWYEHMFEKLGWMVLASQHGHHEKIKHYIYKLRCLKGAIEQKLKAVKNVDKKADLKIMHRNLCVLMKHVEKDFPQARHSKRTTKRTTRRRTSSRR